MVTIYKVENSKIDGEGKFLVELRGLSEDDKPTSLNGGTIQNGSTYTEIDTGDVYMYDLDNTSWYKVASGSGDTPTPTPTIKYYAIPEISTSYATPGTPETGSITDTDTVAVLDEIRNDFENDANIVNKISCRIYYDEDGLYNTTSCIAGEVSSSYTHLTFMFVAQPNSCYYLHIYKYTNTGYNYSLYKVIQS